MPQEIYTNVQLLWFWAFLFGVFGLVIFAFLKRRAGVVLDALAIIASLAAVAIVALGLFFPDDYYELNGFYSFFSYTRIWSLYVVEVDGEIKLELERYTDAGNPSDFPYGILRFNMERHARLHAVVPDKYVINTFRLAFPTPDRGIQICRPNPASPRAFFSDISAIMLPYWMVAIPLLLGSSLHVRRRLHRLKRPSVESSFPVSDFTKPRI